MEKLNNTMNCPNIFQQLLRRVGAGSLSVPIAKQTAPVELGDPKITSCLSALPAQLSSSMSPLLVTPCTGKADFSSAPSLESPVPQDAFLNGNLKNPGNGESLVDLENVANSNGNQSRSVHDSVTSGFSPSRGLRFQSRYSHLKKFVMFDHSGGKGRIFFHPALVREWSIATPESQESSKEDRNFIFQSSLMENTGFQEVEGFGDTSFNVSLPGSSGLDVRMKAYRDTVAAAFATLQSMRTGRLCDLDASCSKDVAENVCAVNAAESSSHVSCASARAISGSLHENTEDLDALLSSDDDEASSTGHTPEDITSKERYFDSSVRSEEHKIPLSKRRRCSSGKEVSVNAGQHGEEFSDVSVLASSSLEVMANSESSEYPLALGTLKHDRVSLKVNDPSQTSLESFGAVSPQLQSFISGHSSSARRARKHKIKKTVRALRNMIPGGNCVDAAVVLDETIQYVKSLQHKVHKLEACRAAKTGK